MLSKRRNGSHGRLDARDIHRRDERRKRPDRRLDGLPAIARCQLGMLDEFADGVHPGIGNLRCFEPLDDLPGAETAEDLVDHRVQFAPMGDTMRVRVEAGIRGQLRTPQHDAAEALPFAFVLNTQVDCFAVPALERAVGRDRRMVHARPRRRLSAATIVGWIAHPLAESLEHRDVDGGALFGPVPAQERRQDPGVRIHSGGDVGDRDPDLAWLLLGACDGEQACLALDQQIVGLLVAVRTRRPVPGDIADDERWIGLPQPIRSEGQARRRSRRKILDEYVRATQQAHEDLLSVRLPEIQRQRLLRSVQPDEVTRHAADGRVVGTREVSDARPFDLDHARAQVGEMPCGKRRRDSLLQGDDGEPLERSHQYERGSPRTRSAT